MHSLRPALFVFLLKKLKTSLVGSIPAVFFLSFMATTTAGPEKQIPGTVLSFPQGWHWWMSDTAIKSGCRSGFQAGGAFIEQSPTYLNLVTAVQLIKPIVLKPGGKYQLVFDAVTTNRGELGILYCLNRSPHTSFGRNVVVLEPDRKHYNVDLDIRSDADLASGSLRLLFGKIRSAKITITNIGLEETLPFQLSGKWQVFLKPAQPDSWGKIPETLVDNQGRTTRGMVVEPTNHTFQLETMAGGFKEDDMALLYKQWNSERAGTMRVGFAADWKMELFLNGKPFYNTTAQGNGSHRYVPEDHICHLPVKKGDNLLVAKVYSGSAGWKFVCGVPAARQDDLTFTADAVWKKVDLSQVRIQPGSALDLSPLAAAITPGEPGRLPRLAIGPSGRLATAENPDRPVRLRGYTFPGWWALCHQNGDWKQNLDMMAENTRRHGYNVVRFFHPDIICWKQDMTVDPQMLDRLDYLLAGLKKHGIYMYLTLFCYGGYQKRGNEVSGVTNAARLYLRDPVVRKLWEFGATTLLHHVNPYTGIAWKDEPTIAAIEFFNEQEYGVELIKRLPADTRELLNKTFRQWLRQKYRDLAALAQAWNIQKPNSFEQISSPSCIRGNTPANPDFVRFCNELSRESFAWCEKVVRDTGYQGLTAQYDLPLWMGDNLVRFECSQLALRHTYFKHPYGPGIKYFNPWGTRCDQNSSVAEMASYWRDANTTRFADRPFFVTEYNHSFWNRYQREGGMVFAAYSALQGYDALIVHDRRESMLKIERATDSFCIDNNPVALANEFITACLFARGDVRTSPHRIESVIAPAATEKGIYSSISAEQNKLGLLCGFNISFPYAKRPAGLRPPSPADGVINASGQSAVQTSTWGSIVVDLADQTFSLNQFVKILKQRKILSADNITEPGRGIFQSDTGQITMRSRECLLKVVTDKTEAVVFEAVNREKLRCLELIESSVPACVAACAMDGRNLATSKRVVLIFSTAVANTDMKLSADRVQLLALGKLPILMQSGKVTLRLQNAQAFDMSLYALNFDGSRREKLPLKKQRGMLDITIDTATLKQDPTPFFELCGD